MSPARLFVYYRVEARDEAAAVEAMRALHVTWQPALRCELLRKDDGGEQVTLVEVYSARGGVNTEWERRIETEALRALARWLVGARHVERFEPCA